jgi:glycosyltransferase involved in cell wall biosynthesis
MDSVLAQKYQDFEIIILDDCSKDESKFIIEEYRPNPKVSAIVYNEVNSGSPFKQWKKGIDLAKGTWIWIAESDDWADENFLNALMSKRKEGVGLIYCRSYQVINDITRDYFWPDGLDTQRWKSDFFNSGKSEVRDYLLYRNTIPNASACLFKKSVIEIDDIVLNMKYCGDWLVWVKTLLQTDLYFVSTPLNYYRMHAETTRTMKNPVQWGNRFSEYYSVINFITESFRINLISPYQYDWLFCELYQGKFTFGVILKRMPPIKIGEMNFRIFLFKKIVRYYMNTLNRGIKKLVPGFAK